MGVLPPRDYARLLKILNSTTKLAAETQLSFINTYKNSNIVMSTQNKHKTNIPKLGEANPGTPICSFMTPPENSQHCLPLR